MKNKKLPVFDFKPCVSCGICVQACPFSCIELSVNGVDALKNLYPKVDAETCTGCSLCAKSCPTDAIAMDEAA